MKHDAIYNEAIKQAQDDWNNPKGKEFKDMCPYLFSSNMADAYYITAYSLYWNGRTPRALHKSKGHSWQVDIPGLGEIKVTVDKPDHREGISVIGGQENET